MRPYDRHHAHIALEQVGMTDLGCRSAPHAETLEGGVRVKDRASSGRTWTYPQRCWRTRRALVARLGPSTTHTFTCQAARRTVARTSVGAGEGWIATFGRTSRTAARALRSRGSSIHPRIWPARPPGAAIAGSAQPDGLLRRHFSRFGSGSEYPIGFRSFGRGTRSGAPVRIVHICTRTRKSCFPAKTLARHSGSGSNEK